MILLVYVDDILAVVKDNKDIETLIKSLKEGNKGFDLTSEPDIENYLGVEINKISTGKTDYFEMKQTHLIQRILDFVKIDGQITNKKETPVTQPLLHKDLDGPVRKYAWN